jgi:hypothetical protein
MKKRDLVIGETYKTSRYLKAVYLGEVNTYKTGGSIFRQRTIGSEHGTPTPAFAVSFGYYNGDGWSPEFVSLQTIECTWEQWEGQRERQRLDEEARTRRDQVRTLIHKQQAQTLARVLGPGVSVEVDQYGYAKIDAQQLIDRLTVKVSA